MAIAYKFCFIKNLKNNGYYCLKITTQKNLKIKEVQIAKLINDEQIKEARF